MKPISPRDASLLTWLWIFVFIVCPLFCIVLMSVMSRGPYGGYQMPLSLGSYTYLFSASGGGIFWTALFRSLVLSLITTLACALLGYPVAYFIRFYGGKFKALLLFMLVIPFWSNFLIRTYSWFNLLSDKGWINTLLESMGWPKAEILFTPAAVLAGMVYNYVPYMTLAIYMGLQKIDVSLLEAARDLGAPQWKRFFGVTFPLSLPSLGSGAILVFIPSLAEFVIPDILGGSTTVYLGGLITQQYLSARNWPLGSAMSLIMMVIIGLVMLAARKNLKGVNHGDLIS